MYKLNHTSAFFRYRDIDELIVNCIRKMHNKNTPLNILSIGCSYGEEPYSYAVALDDLKPKPNIIGFDVSQEAISHAKEGKFLLSDREVEYLFSEQQQIYQKEEPSEFKLKLRYGFQNNFKKTSYVDPEFQKKDNALKNCQFHVGDVTKLKEMYDKESQDVILCRYVLYHLSTNEIQQAFKDIYETLKPGGLFCIEPTQYHCYQFDIVRCGFKQPFRSAPCIFQKPIEPKGIKNSFKQLKNNYMIWKSNHKPNLDDIE